MNYIIKTIENYLSRSTDYAVLINGPWGSGKTYFFKNSLVQTIQKIDVPTNNKLKFLPIYISLYGLETIEEIKNTILAEIFPILNSRVATVGRSVVNLAAKIFKISSQDINEEFHKALGKDNNNQLFDYQTLVICLDDFERRGKKLELDAVLGYINSLVQEGVKLIIIANEEKVDKVQTFKEIKEKTIGITVNFNPSFDKIVIEMITSRYKGNVIYSKYLSDYQSFIIKLAEDKTNNLRTIIYWLDCFTDIFTQINDKFKAEETHVLKEINQELLRFSFAVSNEYREGQLSYSNLVELDSDSNLNNLRALEDDIFSRNKKEDKPEANQKLINTFMSKYYEKEKLKFFKSIFSYITTFNRDFLNNLETEINELFSLNSNEIPEHETTYSKLFNNSIYLSDSQYKSEVNKLYAFVKAGAYTDVIEYVNSFILLIRYDNTLKFDLQKVADNTIKGAKKAKLVVYSIQPFLINELIHGKYSDNIKYVVEGVLDIGKAYTKRYYRQAVTDLKQKLKSDNFSDFSEYERIKFMNKTYPYFKDFSAKVTAKILIRKELPYIIEFNNFLDIRRRYFDSDFITELEFFTELIKLLEAGKFDNRKRMVFNVLIETLQKIVNTIHNYQNN